MVPGAAARSALVSTGAPSMSTDSMTTGGATCTGRVSELDNTAVGGDCTFADGSTVTVRASWDSSQSESVTGRLEVTA